MLKRCEKEGTGEIRCFGAGPRSDRSARVEEKRERESILNSQKRSEATEEVPRSALYAYHPPFSGLKVFFWGLEFCFLIIIVPGGPVCLSPSALPISH